MTALGEGWRLALTTLTVLPVRGPARLDRRAAGTAMTLAPVVGLLLGALAAGALEGLRALTPAGTLLPAVAAVAVLAALTRGLHLDGLADTADGLASYLPPERARAVMKAPDVGALGLVAVVLALALQAAALAAAAQAGRGVLAVVLAGGVSRLAVTAACTPGTPAATGTGLGAQVSGSVRPGVPLALGIALLGGAGLVAGGATGAARVLLAGAAGLLAARVLRRHAVRRLGGVSGDVLGALVEVATTAVLLVMALG